MKLDTWLTFFLAAWLICLSPGPGMLSGVTAGMRWGFRRALQALRNPGVVRWTNRGFGSLFIGAGAALAAFRR